MTNKGNKNILVLVTYYAPHWTGLTEYAKRFAETMSLRGYKVSVLTVQHDVQLPLIENINGVNVKRVPLITKISRTPISVSMLAACIREIVRHDTIIIYAPMVEIAYITIIAKIMRRRVVIVHNGDLIMPSGLFNRLIEKVWDVMSFAAGVAADNIVTYSQDYAMHSRFVKHFLKKSRIIYPLLPISVVSDANFKLSNQIQSSNSPVIGFAGRFVEEKGFDTLLQAIPLVLKRFPDVNFVFAGEVSIAYEFFYETQLKLIKQLRKSITLLGRLSQSEMVAFYRNLDVFVLPSRSDCMPSVQLEAMLNGVPVVATDIPGARVPVNMTGMGLIVPPEDPRALSEGIIQVLTDRKRYTSNSKVFMSIFANKEIEDQYEAII